GPSSPRSNCCKMMSFLMFSMTSVTSTMTLSKCLKRERGILVGRIYVKSRPLYPIAGTTSPRSDDGSSPLIPLSNFVNKNWFICFQVNQNGHLTFNGAFSSYSPQRFPMYGTRDIIAVFWTDLDNRVNGEIYYNQYTSSSVLQQATQDINRYFPGLNFNANWVFVATWYEVAYYPTTGTRTTIQAVLISGGQYSFVLMNYGIIALTTHNVQAGYDTENSTHHFTIPGSFSNNATGIYSAFRLGSNVNVPGRWAFRIDLGSRVVIHITIPSITQCFTSKAPAPMFSLSNRARTSTVAALTLLGHDWSKCMSIMKQSSLSRDDLVRLRLAIRSLYLL
uniref:NIDO domain-containing protein n=1 Tax=Sander lucioperca TaxID=283035 RepID=A0A8C9YGD7_SANLU